MSEWIGADYLGVFEQLGVVSVWDMTKTPQPTHQPMTNASEATADTTIMTIVHDALRRASRRFNAVMSTTTPGPAPRQIVALGRHGEWMMDFLDRHHHAEDDGLWPLLRQPDPRTGPSAGCASSPGGRGIRRRARRILAEHGPGWCSRRRRAHRGGCDVGRAELTCGTDAGVS